MKPRPTFLLRFVISFIYYGLTLNMGKLAGNLFLNFLVGVTVEGLGYLLCFLMNKTGRKPMHLTVMFGSGFGCLLSILPALFLDSCMCKYNVLNFSFVINNLTYFTFTETRNTIHINLYIYF